MVKAVYDGTFDLPTMVPTGPRELADTTKAMNEMATTLGAVETRALALVDRSGDREPDERPSAER